MITVTSTFAATPRALADARGPYAGSAASPVTLTGAPIESSRTFTWRTGDGGTATAAVVEHVYARAGTYVAALATAVAMPGGITSRELARVRIRPVPPRVDAGPDGETPEGRPYRLVAGFTDAEGAGNYAVVIDWGDDSLPDVMTVTVAGEGPADEPVTAEHAYCDNGTYRITVAVSDSEGATGRDSALVVVSNVPPEVDAGPDCFAYECVPLDLVARFADPGWCDAHRASWDFGDCTPVQPAVVKEKHQPPAGTGTASAIHTYRSCGTFLATCRVTDDDGATTAATRVVRVTGLVNASFEDGFRVTDVGQVVNGWTPYPRAGACTADMVVLQDSRRSQRLQTRGGQPAGIWQHLGTNPGWDYQITAWYAIAPNSTGFCRLALDPAGGTDPSGPSVVSAEGDTTGQWQQLVARVRAEGDVLTVMLDVVGSDVDGLPGRGSDAEAWFDHVQLEVLPCGPLVEPPPVTRPVRRCLDWYALEDSVLGPRDSRSGFVVESAAGEDLRVVTWGPPAPRGKLYLSGRGVAIDLPFPADSVHVTVYVAGREPVVLFTETEDGARTRTDVLRGQTELTTVSATGPRLVRLLVIGANGEDLLLEVCAEHTDAPVPAALPLSGSFQESGHAEP
jgi:hypothetical protein